MTSNFIVGDFSTDGQPSGPAGRDHAFTPTRPDALPPGTRLDEYEIGPLLSESPLGLVYLATDHSLGRKVAIREYMPSALSGRGDGPLVALRAANMSDAYRRGLRAFVEEARLLARFDDPSLLRVLRFWEAHFTAYIVMPYYDAPTLTAARERLEVPPAEPWIRSLLESLANALELLHGESCLHRNVTPDRILMLRDGRPMLLGPSAVRQVLGREAHTTLIQPGFSAIEEYAESSDLPQGPWTDVYALGALARFCILGMVPVAATVRSVRDPLVGMLDAIFPLRVQWPELEYSANLLATIDRSLAVDPAQRPQSMAEFRALLRGPQASPTRGGWSATRPSSSAAPTPRAPADEAPFDPTRPEPDLNLLSATDLETDDFEASLSAMVDAALIDAPPMRTTRGPADAEAPRPASAVPPTAPPADEPSLSVDVPMEPSFAHQHFETINDHGRFSPSGRPRWQRPLTAVAAVLLLGAFGYVGWTQYERLQEEERVAARVPATSLPAVAQNPPAPAAPAAPGASEAVDPIAEARLHPPAAGVSPDAASLSTPVPAAETPASAPAEAASAPDPAATAEPPAAASVPAPDNDPAPEPKPPARTARLARAAEREARAARTAPEPRAVCGARSDFALYRCMETQCDKPQYAGNAQCRQFKLLDKVD